MGNQSRADLQSDQSLSQQRTMLKFAVIAALVAVCAAGKRVRRHETDTGECPTFPPMQGFDFDRFAEGKWYALEKFGTHELKCLTYDFGVNGYGFKQVTQKSVSKTLDRLSLANYHTSRGNLEVPSSSQPANMVVRFSTNLYGPSSFVIMDTDYNDYALLCTCQSAGLIITTLHRRSCTILGREPVRNPDTMRKLKDFLDQRLITGDQPFSHDFDIIDHRNCNYDSTQGLDLDLDKVLGGDVGTVVGGAIDTVSDIFGDDLREKEDANSLPLKDEN